MGACSSKQLTGVVRSISVSSHPNRTDLGNLISNMPVKRLKFRRWASSFVRLDPRFQVSQFLKPGDVRGPYGYLASAGKQPIDACTHYFSVFRPTSDDALRMMILGRATGKGLNIKGKSAKKGVLSGFVPFVQVRSLSVPRLSAKRVKPVLDEVPGLGCFRVHTVFPTISDTRR